MLTNVAEGIGGVLAHCLLMILIGAYNNETDQVALAKKIRQLATDKQAIILAHNYQWPEVQEAADVVGDSLGLSLEAQKTNAKIGLTP